MSFLWTESDRKIKLLTNFLNRSTITTKSKKESSIQKEVIDMMSKVSVNKLNNVLPRELDF